VNVTWCTGGNAPNVPVVRGAVVLRQRQGGKRHGVVERLDRVVAQIFLGALRRLVRVAGKQAPV